MRIMSIIIALLVCVALYFFIFERDRLTSEAGAPVTIADVEPEEDAFAPPA